MCIYLFLPLELKNRFTLHLDEWKNGYVALCAIVKAWQCQGSRIWPKCDVTRKQEPMRVLVSFTLQRNLRANMCRTRHLAYSPQPACSVWPAGFMSISFYLSKPNIRLQLETPSETWEFCWGQNSGGVLIMSYFQPDSRTHIVEILIRDCLEHMNQLLHS